jgi:hypothetical protein
MPVDLCSFTDQQVLFSLCRVGGRTFWVIGVSAPAVVTGMYLIDDNNFEKGYGDRKNLNAINWRLAFACRLSNDTM